MLRNIFVKIVGVTMMSHSISSSPRFFHDLKLSHVGESSNLQYRGFAGVDGMIMIGFSLIILLAITGMHIGLINTIVPTLHEKINYVPTFYVYDNGTRIDTIPEADIEAEKRRRSVFNESEEEKINDIRVKILELEQEKLEAIKIVDQESIDEIDEKIDNYNQKLLEMGFDPDPNRNFKLYWMFGVPASMFFVALLILSLVVLLVERINLGVQRGTAMKIFKISVISLAIIYAVPEVWDPIAIVINNAGLYMLDPVDGKPHETVEKLFCRMGNVCVEDSRVLLDQDVHKSLIANPNMGVDFFSDIFLGLFRVTIESMMAITFFISSTIRISFMLMIVITLPLWLVFRCIPPMKKVTNAVLSSFVGCCFASPLISIILFIGEENLVGNPGDAMTEWITVLSIALLAQTFLMILAPILQSSMSQATSTVSTGIMSTSAAVGSAGGMVAGAASAKLSKKSDAGRDYTTSGSGPGADPRRKK